MNDRENRLKQMHPDKIAVLHFLADNQDKWCSWFGDQYDNSITRALENKDPDYAQKIGNSLIKKGYSGGCDCGCRGDYCITDEGLALIGRERTEPYNGY